ncbi:MAG: hypothetical protein CMM46_10840 [Rhodospirillaceae bacterium]|nr:hypothetical protein [Rhodospirillaceae bacterium]
MRDPSDVMAMLDDGRLYSAQAGRLDALAGRRQGVAARLLELRYAIGKTASTSEQGDAGTDHDIEALRNQVETSEEQLQFIDDEIALLLQSFCLEE